MRYYESGQISPALSRRGILRTVIVLLRNKCPASDHKIACILPFLHALSFRSLDGLNGWQHNSLGAFLCELL